MTGPWNAPYERRCQDPRLWPSRIVYGLYAEVVAERAVNELSWEWAGAHVADQASAYLRAQQAREERQKTAQAEGWRQGEPGDSGE